MKIALYIEDGLEQIVLTPESETEKAILRKMHDGSRELSIKQGEFYACQGGWTRHAQTENSTMVILRPKPKSEFDPRGAVYRDDIHPTLHDPVQS